MIESFFHKESRSIISCSRSSTSNKWWINRINVPPAHRGKGIASHLLRKTCTEADSQGVILRLHVSPDASGKGLDFEQLCAFYQRYGFFQIFGRPAGDYARLPQRNEARAASPEPRRSRDSTAETR